MDRAVAGVLSLLAVLVAVPIVVSAAGPCWPPPVTGVVVDPFRAPACPYCSGNRGLEYAVAADTVVRAVVGGQVTWSGRVAGVSYVVVRHANGWRTTYGRLDATVVRTGDRVVAGSRLGIVSGRFHFGLRRGDDTYLDPAPYLGSWEWRRRLVPVQGPARAAPPPRLRCAGRG